MNFYKNLSFLSIILILIIFVGAVSATETNLTDSLVSSNENIVVEQIDESVSYEFSDNSQVLGAGDSDVLGDNEGSFRDLSTLINSSRGNPIILDKDYKFNLETDGDFVEGIQLWPWNVDIDGNGHTIDGDHQARIFNATLMLNKKFTLKNIKFVNGFAGSDSVDKSRGGAIIIGPNCVRAEFTNCTFENNWANNTDMGVPYGNETNRIHHSEGGAIFISGTKSIIGIPSALKIIDCTFRNNTANYGGAIYSSSSDASGTVIVQNSLFDDNHAVSHPYNDSNGVYYFNNKYYSHGWGGAIYAFYTDIDNTTFINNKGGNNSGFGGAVSSYNGVFKNSKFINNTCFQGGAIADGEVSHGENAPEVGSHYVIDNCTFDNNKAQLCAGAVLTREIAGYNHVDVEISNTNFTNNYGGIYGGGAVMAAWPSISNTNFINNSAYNYGGALSSGTAFLSDVSFVNNSAAHSAALFCIEPYFQNTNITFEGNYILNRILYDNGFTENTTEVQDGKVIVTSQWTLYPASNGFYYMPYDRSGWIPVKGEPLPSMYQYVDSFEKNKGIGYYGHFLEVDLYGHAIEYELKDVKGGYGQNSPGGAEGIVTDDLSYLINYIDGRELKEYIKILYYLCNLDPDFMDGAFRNEKAGELALEFPIHELCFSNLSAPINGLMKNIADLYDSGFRVPDKYYKLSEVLKDHMAHSDVMVPDNADEILKDDKTVILYRPFLYIVPFYNTHYLMYYQTNLTIEKIARNKTVLLGEDVEFEVKVTNGGNYSVYDIFVKDDKYDHDGLIFKEYRNGTGKWVYDNKTGKYNLVDNVTSVYYIPGGYDENNNIVRRAVYYNTPGALAPRSSKSIIFVFTTNKTGVFNNTATNGYSNATNNTTVVGPDMKVEKITLNKTVYLGNVTMFKIRVTNIGEVDLTNIVVDEVDYDEGLVLTDWKGAYPWFGNIDTKKFVYLDTLKPQESAEFIVMFNTTSIGNKTNYVNASSKQTGNRSANNTTEVVPIRVNVTKVWEDKVNQDGIRPTSVIIELYADGVKINESELSDENGWSVLFKDLPMVKDRKVINYYVREKAIDDYEVEITNITTDDFTIIVANNTYNFTVTNVHNPYVTNVIVNKVWNDSDNQDGLRPANVTVHLLADGTEVRSAVLSADNNWTFTFTGLAVNDKGKVIAYSVKEDIVDNYINETSKVDNYTFVVINTHVPELINITVNKKWNDSDNQDGLRPSNVTVHLFANGTEIDSAVITAENNWTYKFIDLEANKDGKPINYSIKEDKVAGYAIVEIKEVSDNVFNVSNTHVPELTNITVNKVWIDNDNYDKVRPENVTVRLLADGEVVAEVILSEKNNWTYNFTDLAVNTAGKPIKYAVEEVNVPDYNTTVENFTVINTHVRPDMAVEKITLNKTVLVGEETSFTIKVTNTGNCDLTDITVVEDAPEGLRYDGKFNGENWYNNGNEFLYKGILAPGESISFNITFTAVKQGDWLNKVNATSNETDNKTTNNTTSVLKPDMEVRKITLNESVYLGKQVGFTIVVINTGNADLTGVYVIDNDYTEGIVLDHMLPNDDWTFDGKNKFTYGKTLGVGQSANFTVIFNTTSTGNKINNVTADSNETPEVNSSNKTHVYVGNMTVQKISHNQNVKVGEMVSFTIIVKNTGDCDLTGVYVVDEDYSSGLVYDHFVDSSNKWKFDGISRWNYDGVLGIGQEAQFDVVFKATSAGFKVNNVTAGNNVTNETVNSTNTTNVTKETVPPKPVPPVNPTPQPQPQPRPPAPEVPDVSGKSVESRMHATGNPLVLVVLALFAVGVIPKRRRK